MTPQELRNSILRSALQGKLTKQNAFEMVDLSLINAQKNAKMENSEFDIPDNWYLSTLEGFCEVIPTKPYQILEKQVKPVGKYPVISQSKEYQIGFTDDRERLYIVDTPIIAFGDHTTVVKYIDFDFVVGADGVKLFKPNHLVYPQYLLYALQLLTYSLEKIGGYSRHYKFIKNKPIPVPPFAEQQRIAARLEKIISYIDRYEQAWTRLEQFNKQFPIDMQESILQMAIQGKLVEQISEEGTAEELYQQIQEEKQQLIKEGKIKKEKPLPKIAENEVPFEIPESWKWVRLGLLTELITSGSRDWAKYYSDTGDLFLRMGNLSKNSFELRFDKVQRVTLPENAEGKRTALKPGDLLFSITGDVGMLGLIPPNFGPAFINQHTAMLRFMPIEQNKYVPYLLLTDYAQKFYNGNQHGIKNSFRLDSIALLPIPLPPLAEQKRIVAKLEELLPLCERLK